MEVSMENAPDGGVSDHNGVLEEPKLSPPPRVQEEKILVSESLELSISIFPPQREMSFKDFDDQYDDEISMSGGLHRVTLTTCKSFTLDQLEGDHSYSVHFLKGPEEEGKIAQGVGTSSRPKGKFTSKSNMTSGNDVKLDLMEPMTP
nr:pachytene checkpoint protein 2 homolog [Ipomoea batatas]